MPTDTEEENYESSGESGPPSARDVLTEESKWSNEKFRKVHSARMYNVDQRLKDADMKISMFAKKCIGFCGRCAPAVMVLFTFQTKYHKFGPGLSN